MERVAHQPDGGGVDPATAPAVDPDVAAVELDGETVVYHERTGGLHLLNPTASIIWHSLDGETPLRRLAADLAGATATDPARVEADVLGAVGDFASLELLRAPGGDAAAQGAPIAGPGSADDPSAESGPTVVEVPGSR